MEISVYKIKESTKLLETHTLQNSMAIKSNKIKINKKITEIEKKKLRKSKRPAEDSENSKTKQKTVRCKTT